MAKLVIFPVGLLITPDGKRLDALFLESIKSLAEDNVFVAVSDAPKPQWFDEKCGKPLLFCNAPALGSGSRKSGKFVDKLLTLNAGRLQKSQIVMLGFTENDIPMYANSKSVLIRCDWRTDICARIRDLNYGIPCALPSELGRILVLLDEQNPWYYTAADPAYDTYVLTNGATRAGHDEELKVLASRLQDCLKRGNPTYRQEFMIHLLSSLYATTAFQSASTWTYYPSSHSDNTGKEIIAEFVEIARTTFKARKKPDPLIIRHKPTAARHTSAQNGRMDPREQVESIHLHPSYKGTLAGKTVVIFDDYTTYGLSFSVAAAFLKKAGAAKVLAVAAGKFPRTPYIHEIEIGSDPFAPVSKFSILATRQQNGVIAPEASSAFKRKFA